MLIADLKLIVGDEFDEEVINVPEDEESPRIFL
jgi:hypothetical protein